MESSVLVALITAITSIIVALIQMTASLRVARLKEPPIQPRVIPERPKTATNELTPYRTWFRIGSVLVVSNIIWLIVLGTAESFLLQFGAVVWCTCLLAYFRPIQWTYVAGVVTLFNMIWLMASYLEVGAWASNDLVLASMLYVVNTLLATAIAYFRTRNAETK